eukprot:scaffold3150_cov51-Attheya_sp.AAC.7
MSLTVALLLFLAHRQVSLATRIIIALTSWEMQQWDPSPVISTEVYVLVRVTWVLLIHSRLTRIHHARKLPDL